MEIPQILRMIDHGGQPVYVIGHRPADADSVCSAIALANLYQKIGIPAEARIASEPDHETEAAFSYLGVSVPPILSDAAGKQLAMVDHNSFSHAVPGAKDARIVGIFDHHALSDAMTTSIVPVIILPYGSTGTIVYMLYRQYGIEIDRVTASVLATAIMSDTNNCRYLDSAAFDRFALDDVIRISGIDRNEFNRTRLRGRIDYGSMTDREVLLSDYRSYEVEGKRIGICYARSVGEENHREMIARLQTALERYYPESGMELLYLMIHDYDTDRQDILYCGNGAGEAAIEAIGSVDGVHISLKRSISRKGEFLPALAKTLEKHI